MEAGRDPPMILDMEERDQMMSTVEERAPAQLMMPGGALSTQAVPVSLTQMREGVQIILMDQGAILMDEVDEVALMILLTQAPGEKDQSIRTACTDFFQTGVYQMAQRSSQSSRPGVLQMRTYSESQIPMLSWCTEDKRRHRQSSKTLWSLNGTSLLNSRFLTGEAMQLI